MESSTTVRTVTDRRTRGGAVQSAERPRRDERIGCLELLRAKVGEESVAAEEGDKHVRNDVLKILPLSSPRSSLVRANTPSTTNAGEGVTVKPGSRFGVIF